MYTYYAPFDNVQLPITQPNFKVYLLKITPLKNSLFFVIKTISFALFKKFKF